jgi:hypothetical protein
MERLKRSPLRVRLSSSQRKFPLSMKFPPSLPLLALAFICHSASAATATIDIRNYGAKADGATVNTLATQAAIDASSAAGGGEVRVTGGAFVTGTILLKDGVILRVDSGASLLGSDNPLDFRSIDPFIDATGQTRGKRMIGAVDATRVGIVGSGTIDGRGGNYQPSALRENLKRHGIDESQFKEFASDRPFLVRFVRSTPCHPGEHSPAPTRRLDLPSLPMRSNHNSGRRHLQSCSPQQ